MFLDHFARVVKVMAVVGNGLLMLMGAFGVLSSNTLLCRLLYSINGSNLTSIRESTSNMFVSLKQRI
jgi:hypothetical protein